MTAKLSFINNDMPERNIHCLMLRQKLQVYYQHDYPASDELVKLKNNAQLAKALGIKSGTLSNLLNGRDDGREEHLPSKHLDWLVDQLMMATEGRLSRSQAMDTWRYASVSGFEYHLRSKPPTGIMAALMEQTPTIEVNITEAPATMDLNMFEENYEPMPEERIIEVGRNIRIEVETREDSCLVILSRAPKEWFWLSPSKHHSGPTIGGLEFIPPGKGLGLEARGPYTIIAIELEGQSTPYVRDRNTPPTMRDHMERLLEEELRSGRKWGWGEAAFFAEEPERITSSTQ